MGSAFDVNPWIRILRPGNGAISLAGTLIGGLSVVGVGSVGGPAGWGALLLAGLTTFLVTSGGNVLNDYLDREGDRVNHPDRPLVTGEMTPEGARTYARILLGVSPFPLVVAAGLELLYLGESPWSLLLPFSIWALAVALLLAYEYRWKARGLQGNATVALLTGVVFLFGASVTGHPSLALPWTAMATLSTLSREVIKDMEDRLGDVGRTTLPRARGNQVAGRVARGSVLAAILLSPLPLLYWLPLRSAAGIMYALLVLGSDVVFLMSVWWLPERLHREQGLSKVAMILALGAFLGASLR